MRRPTLASLAVVCLFAVTGCSGDDDDDSSDALSAEATQPEPGTTLLVDDQGDPTRINFTSTITITEGGFVPLQAIAVFDQTLTFVNETDRDQTITFTNGSPAVGGPQTFGPIPAGQSMSWPEPLSAAISLVYEADALPGKTGRLEIDKGTDQL